MRVLREMDRTVRDRTGPGNVDQNTSGLVFLHNIRQISVWKCRGQIRLDYVLVMIDYSLIF